MAMLVIGVIHTHLHLIIPGSILHQFIIALLYVVIIFVCYVLNVVFCLMIGIIDIV